MIAKNAIVRHAGKNRRILEAIYATPTRGGIVFSDIESLVLALGGVVREGAGSRIVLELEETRRYLTRPHPGKEAKKYQIKELGEWFHQLEIFP